MSDQEMKQFDITKYGVSPDTRDLQTEKIQSVIERCRAARGGEILIPSGRYFVGSLRLYSNMTLHLLEGAELYGSKDYRDYTDFHVPTTMKYVKDSFFIKKWNLPEYYIYGVICAFDEENVSIVGEKHSVINGQNCFDKNGEEKFRGPMGIILSNCRNVHLKGYTFADSANWSHQIDGCERVRIEGVTVLAGHDGFNLHHCSHVKVSSCRLETGDDCVAGYDTEHLLVENCYLNTACNAMRLGGNDLVFDKCIFEGPGHYPHISENTCGTHAVFKYYAIGADDMKQDADEICLKNCELEDITKLFVYQYGRKEWFQDRCPLRSMTLENVTIKGKLKESVWKGNGAQGKLIWKHVALSVEPEHPGDFLLWIDDDVTLVLDHVISERPVRIKAGMDSKIMMNDCENIDIVRSAS